MYHFQSRQESSLCGLDYSHIQRGSISHLPGSDINWKRKPTCKQKEMQPFLLLPLSSSTLIKVDPSTHLSARADGMNPHHDLSPCLPSMALTQGTLDPPPGVFPSQVSYNKKNMALRIATVINTTP